MIRVSCDIPYKTFDSKILSHISPLAVSKQFNRAIRPVIEKLDLAINSMGITDIERENLIKEKKNVIRECKKEFVPSFPYVEEFSKYGFGGFKYNYAIHYSEDITIYLAYMSNQELTCEGKSLSSELTKWNLTLEFNPNKVRDNPFLLNILRHNWGWIIKSIDLACDIPFKMQDILLLKSPKHLLQTFEKNGVKTYVLGVAPNRIKIYDKKYESNLDYDLTRIEFSVVLDLPLSSYENYNFNLKCPSLCLNEYQLDLSDINIDIQTKCLLHCIDTGFININDLSRRLRDKVLKYKMNKSPIEFCLDSFNKTFKNYISYYFSDLVI